MRGHLGIFQLVRPIGSVPGAGRRDVLLRRSDRGGGFWRQDAIEEFRRKAGNGPPIKDKRVETQEDDNFMPRRPGIRHMEDRDLPWRGCEIEMCMGKIPSRRLDPCLGFRNRQGRKIDTIEIDLRLVGDDLHQTPLIDAGTQAFMSPDHCGKARLQQFRVDIAAIFAELLHRHTAERQMGAAPEQIGLLQG
ncbi:hypothetical protein D3C80_820470 [compost metagenome]